MSKATKKSAAKSSNVNKAAAAEADRLLAQAGELTADQIDSVLQTPAKKAKAVKTPAEKAKPEKGEKKGPRESYRAGSSYAAIVDVLVGFGIGKYHPAADVIKAFPKAMGEGWAAFRDREARNAETGKGTDARVIQNAIVIARPDKYGQPLRDLGYEARKGRDEAGYRFGIFKLGDKTPAPTAPSRAQKPQDASKPKAKAKTAEPKAKPQKKATKAKAAK